MLHTNPLINGIINTLRRCAYFMYTFFLTLSCYHTRRWNCSGHAKHEQPQAVKHAHQMISCLSPNFPRTIQVEFSLAHGNLAIYYANGPCVPPARYRKFETEYYVLLMINIVNYTLVFYHGRIMVAPHLYMERHCYVIKHHKVLPFYNILK